MARVYDVAKYILERQGRMSTWKLEKLCYYAQAWSIAWTEQELFPEEFEAWSNGPVCRELFKEHKGKYLVEKSDMKKGDIKCLTEDERETIDIVLKDYGKMSPYELRELSHSEEPYKQTRGELADGAYSDKVIPKSVMGEYYGGL
ncbi:MAG: DUF4065 domain-containing protein [Synergistaceae bacterium]|nr:DUF4065 domain-containing protein [Synergistaceae bacterium]